MELEFTTTIELDNREIHLNLGDILLKTLKNLYEHKCYKTYFIKEIKKITARGLVTFTTNHYPTMPVVDVTFLAECANYKISDIMAVKITDMDSKIVLCSTEDYVLTFSSEIVQVLKLKKGSSLLVIATNINYKHGSKLAISAIPFQKPKMLQITMIHLPQFENEEFKLLLSKIEQVRLEILEKRKSVKDTFVNAKEIENIKKLKKYSALEDIPAQVSKIMKEHNTQIYFVLNPQDDFFEASYYVSSIEDLQKKEFEMLNKQSKFYTKNISILAMILDHLTIINNYANALIELEKL